MHIKTASTWEDISLREEKDMRKSSTMAAMRNSNILAGFPRNGSPRARIKRTSAVVRRTPCHSSSLGKSKHKAIAEPINSARSVAIMAISARTYKG